MSDPTEPAEVGRSGKQLAHSSVMAELPWGCLKQLGPVAVDPSVKPGEFVAQTLFVEYMSMAERKIQLVLQESVEKPLTKLLQRGEDPLFDQILSALSSVAENCLPSLLRALFAWHDYQHRTVNLAMAQKAQTIKQDSVKGAPSKVAEVRPERDHQLEKKGMAVDFIFCLSLIEVLKQLPLHPGCDDLVTHVIQLAFKQFRYKDVNQLGVSSANAHIIADLYAEVIGTLAQSRFHAVRKRFIVELQELRNKELTTMVAQNIVSLLMGMKFFRVKMVPIEEFEVCMGFLHELAAYFLEVKDREIKHALAALFVEILLPVAASVKTEVNVPVLKTFVEQLYAHTLDLANKRKHSLAFFPLLTCLLCISQKTFFLSNWHYFLAMCLSNLKHKDSKMSRVALESLYRLLWVYVIRIKCESNTATHSRLQSIVHSLFPKGSKNIIPRDAPLNIFVKIIHFIGQERLDFAFREVIFDLLSVGRPIRTIHAERMNIGLRALLVIADGLQQRDGAPPMPRTIGVLPSGNTLRVKKTFLTKPLTTEVARTIGLEGYYAPCRRSLDGIVRALDLQVGRPLLMTLPQNVGKEPDELMGGERKPKLDLFRTCIAALPRIMSEGMSRQDLIDLLCRLTIHLDEELKALACQTLQNFVVECHDWREDVVYGFLQLIIKEIPDSYPQLLDGALTMLLQLVRSWKNALQNSLPAVVRRESNASLQDTWSISASVGALSNASSTTMQVAPVLRSESCALVLHCVEGLALTMLCQGRAYPRRMAVTILKEVKNLLPLLCFQEGHEKPAVDVLDYASSYVIERYLPHVSAADKSSWPSNDFSWLSEKVPSVEANAALVNADMGNEYFQWDAWAAALSGYLEPRFLPAQCPTALAYAWPAAHSRMTAVFAFIDPNNPQNDTRASLLRSSKSKATAIQCGELNQSNYLSLWQKYLVFACAVAPPALNSVPPVLRSASPDTLQSQHGDHLEGVTEVRIPRLANVSATNLFKLVVPLLRSDMTDMRDSVVLGLGSVNPAAFDCLLEEMGPFLREAAEKKQENVRRRKRRDLLRLQLIRLMETAVYRGTLSSAIEYDTGELKSQYIDFIDHARQHLDLDHDRDPTILHSMRLHFAKFVSTLIYSFPLEKRHHLLPKELKTSLFYLFAAWSGRLGLGVERRPSRDRGIINITGLEYFSVCGMCSVLCCGPVFDQLAVVEDGYIYSWLDGLLQSPSAEISTLIEEVLVLLLEFNPDTMALLDWVIDRCYTGQPAVADKCFRAIAAVFSMREYPCDMVAVVAVTLMYCGYAVIETQQVAVELLQLLEQRFFGEDSLGFNSSDEANSGLSSQISPPHPTAQEVRSDNEGSPPQNAGRLSDSVDHEVNMEATFSKSNTYLSQQLAELQPEMTLPMFSEITHRFQTARPACRTALLQFLLPWLHNIELVDPNMDHRRTPTLSLSAKIVESQALARRVLKGEGWGSAPASEMVLNNLMYLTIKFGNEHAKFIEQLWAALVCYWPQNLGVILRYLSIMGVLAPNTVLPYAKRVVIYLARVNPERLVSDITNDLQIIDPWRCPLERTDVAPCYRWARRDDGDTPEPEVPTREARGTIHTKRHTPSEENSLQEIFEAEECNSLAPSASMASLVTLKADVLNARFAAQSAILEQDELPALSVTHKEHATPVQLPMPAYGGYYCPLSEELPDAAEPVIVVHRCYIAMALISDLIVSDVEIDWTVHLPLLLHVGVLGFDHSRELVHEHCKLVIIRLILTNVGSSVSLRALAKVLIAHSLAPTGGSSTNGLDGGLGTSSSDARSVGTSACSSSLGYASSASSSTRSVGAAGDAGAVSVILLKDAYTARFEHVSDLAVAVTNCLSSAKHKPLFSWEDITAKSWRTTSVYQLTCFVSHLSRLMAELMPASHLASRWAQTALHVALSCSSRHYAGRSFQIFRALHVPIRSQMLSDILSRLVETVSEQGEDMQGYVTEIMLTLDASVLLLELAEHEPVMCQANAMSPSPSSVSRSPTHARSTSCSVTPGAAANSKRSSAYMDKRDMSRHLSGEAPVNLPRSKSAQALKSEDQDEHIAALSQLLWIAVSLLDSDYEHEFVLALKLLDKIIDLAPQERQECLDRFSRMVQQLNWMNFPGILSLVLKGCTFGAAFDLTLHVMCKLITLLDSDMIDPTQSTGFAMNVIGLLPYMVLHHEDPTKLCIIAAENICERCSVELDRFPRGEPNTGTGSSSGTMSDVPLEHLATVMKLYSRRGFSKEASQWIRCVVKYLNDTYPGVISKMLGLVTEILDKGPSMIQQPLLQIIYWLFHHVDLASQSAIALNADCLKTVAKFLHSSCWRDAARILKLAVTRSSTLSMPPSCGLSALDRMPSPDPTDPTARKELPGRTLEFTVDLNELTSSLVAQSDHESSPKKQGSAGDTMRKPWLSQVRVREHLVNLLNASGLRVGLPKSPSETSINKVIFSQSSHELQAERHSSTYSSSGELTVAEGQSSTPSPDTQHDSGTDTTFAPVFKEFDFLDGEVDSLSESAESCFNWLGVLRPRSHSYAQSDPDESHAVGSTGSFTGSVPNLMPREPSESDSSDEDSNSSAAEEEEEESESVSAQDMERLFVQSSASQHNVSQNNRPATPNSITLSFGSGGDILVSSPPPPSLVLECPHHASGQIEDVWQQHVASVDSTAVVNATLLFAQLYKEACSKVCSLFREACHFISSSEPFHESAGKFLQALDTLIRVSECPFAFVSTQFLTSGKYVKNWKFFTLELKEHYETFLEKKEHAIKGLNLVKSGKKLRQLSHQPDDGPGLEQELDLFRSLQKLFFQVKVLYDSYRSMISQLETVASKYEQVKNLSSEVSSMHKALICALNEVPEGDNHQPVFGSTFQSTMAQLLQSGRTKEALALLRYARTQCSRHEFGCCEEEDIEALLLVYCRMLADTYPCCIMVVESEPSLEENCSVLQETHLMLCSAVVAAEHNMRRSRRDSGSTSFTEN